MKHAFLSIVSAVLVAVTPLFGQQARQGQDQENEPAEPKTGVRFVNCSPTGIRIPSPLFAKAGKSYRQVRIATRVPSVRVKPDANGVINFYDEDPGAASADTEGNAGGRRGGRGGRSRAEAPEVPPVMSFTVPAGMANDKTLCLVMPKSRENPYDVNSLFVKESAFPKNGVYIINLTDTPLQIKTSPDPNFADSKVEVIGPYSGGVNEKNSWSSPKGADGTTISFILSAKVPGSKEPRRIKASRFTISSRQAQINVVVKDPARPNSFSLQTIQLMDKPEQQPQGGSN